MSSGTGGRSSTLVQCGEKVGLVGLLPALSCSCGEFASEASASRSASGGSCAATTHCSPFGDQQQWPHRSEHALLQELDALNFHLQGISTTMSDMDGGSR